jgi:hypothetical protein
LGSSIFLAKRDYLATATFRHRRFGGGYPRTLCTGAPLRRSVVAAFCCRTRHLLKLGQKLGEKTGRRASLALVQRAVLDL